MFGTILGFDKSKIYVQNAKGIADTNYIGYHVVFPEVNHKIVGEITGIDSRQIVIQLIGEIVNGTFSNGVLKKPSINTKARIIFKSELESILGKQDYTQKENLLVGTSPIYNGYVITCSLNEFFANHFAIIGNTGSGKSCGVARLLQNVFFASAQSVPVNSHIALFDVYGEYYNTFNNLDNYVGMHFKKFTTKVEFGDSELLSIPPYLLDADDLAVLLGATSSTQLPVLRKTISLARIFKSKSDAAQEYKDDIIAHVCLDILSSGKTPTQIRDQVISILSSYYTPTLNLDSEIYQPGYSRTLRQCLNIDEQGKINSINLVIEFLQEHRKVDIEDIKVEDDVTYNLNDLYYALDFALINEGILNSEQSYEQNNILKARLQSIINGQEANYFKFNNFLSKSDFVESFFSTSDGTETAQLVDINLSYIDDSFAKSLVKIFSKMFFEYTTTIEERGSYPIHIILEEAHRYVQNDRDIDILGYNIFDRITKEGRKYGTILGFITQRPNELSKTALSQCSNFIVFRLFYPDDLEIVRGISSNVTDENIEKIKTLHPGMGLVFGSAFKVPLLVNFPLPNPMPVSTSIRVDTTWYMNTKKQFSPSNETTQTTQEVNGETNNA